MVVSRKCEGQSPEIVASWRAQFDDDVKRLTADEDWPAAWGYLIGYPFLLEQIGHDWRSDSLRIGAYYALKAAHVAALQALMREGERVGLDSAPLWEFGRICRELFADEPWRYYIGEVDTWPDCLGSARATLPADYRASITAGEGVMTRLNAKLGIEVSLPTGPRTYLIDDLCRDLNMDNKTLKKFVEQAGLQTAERGQRNHRFTETERQRILETILNKSPTHRHKEAAGRLLENRK